jgi:hypothetical protein
VRRRAIAPQNVPDLLKLETFFEWVFIQMSSLDASKVITSTMGGF